MTHARRPHLDQHLARAGRREVERLDGQWFALLPNDGGLDLHAGILLRLLRVSFVFFVPFMSFVFFVSSRPSCLHVLRVLASFVPVSRALVMK